MLQEIKKFLTNIALIALILGSLFAVCYLPFMQMATARPAAAKTANVDTGQRRCCENQTSPHMLTVTDVKANVVSLEYLLVFLGLAGLFLFIFYLGRTTDQAGLKFKFTQQFTLRLHNYLALAFSKGVLHPKLYNA